MKRIRVHFVGRANTFRCQLAAAYFRSIAPADYIVTSSGLRPNMRFTEIARHLAASRNISFHMTSPKQALQNDLDESDIVVCIDKMIYEELIANFRLDRRKTIVWGIESLDNAARKYAERADSSVLLQVADRIFDDISKSARGLLEYLTAGSWVDVVDKYNNILGLRLPISWVTDRGYWHRAVHVILLTPDNDFVVEKRSPLSVFQPNAIDITLGGLVDSREEMINAALRETKEELGIVLDHSQITLVMIRRGDASIKKFGKHSRYFSYVYLAKLNNSQMLFTPQTEEISSVGVMTIAEIKKLINDSHLESFGHLAQSAQVYRTMLKEIIKKIERHKKSSKQRQKSVK